MPNQRLDYNHLAEVIGESGLVDPVTLQQILQTSTSGGELFTEVLVRDNLVADWELSRLTCEAFHLVFLSLDFYTPSDEAVELFDPHTLHRHGLVPLDVYDELLTVAMPALTPSEVLDAIEEKLGKTIQPVVGTVSSNRRWLSENLKVDPVVPADEDWSSVFDEGDAAVLMDLEQQQQDFDIGDAETPAAAPGQDSGGSSSDDKQLGGLEDLLS